MKRDAHEKVGVMCLKDGKPGVVEYSEISKEMAERADTNGNLVFGQANIATHAFSVDFLERVAGVNLPIHVAKKKIPTISADGEKEDVTPSEPNGIKLEFFIFDSFAFTKKMSCYQCERSEEFAPVKRPSGPGQK